jgi:hypothetical protein
MRGGSVGRAAEAARQRRRWAVRRRRWQREGGGRSAAEALDAAVAARRWRAAGRQGGVRGGGRAVAAAEARRWRRHGGRGGGGGSPITPATALPIPLLIAAARLGDVAVSLCGLRGCGGLLGGSPSSNVFYQYIFVVLCFGVMAHNLQDKPGGTRQGGQPNRIHSLRVGWRNLPTLRVGWRNLFSSCAVVLYIVSVFGSGGK